MSDEPIHLDECGQVLPRNETCDTVRFHQFLVPGCLGEGLLGHYAIIPPQNVSRPQDDIARSEINEVSQQRLEELEARLPVAKGIISGRLPDPDDAEAPVRDIRQVLDRDAKGRCPVDADDAEVRRIYARYIEALRRDEMTTTDRALRRVGYAGPAIRTRTQLRQAVTEVHFPKPLGRLDSLWPKVAFCALYEQSWCHAGYSRGELVTSLSLAPGEELTLEVHSWTKDSFKSERELARETGATIGNKLTSRDHLEVLSKLAVDKKVGVKTDAKASIPLEGLPIGITGGASSETVIKEALDTTLKRTSEATVEASTSLRSQRKLRIEVAREQGRDDKQLRKVANTNRCHTLNVHYFEVMSHYDVTLRLVDLVPCVLIKLTHPDVTWEWVLCHQYLLEGGLLDRSFLTGLEAARVLATQAELERIEAEREQSEAGSDPPPSLTPAPSDPVEAELADKRRAIVDAYQELLAVEALHADDIADIGQLLESGAVLSAAGVVDGFLQDSAKLLALGALRLNRPAVQAVEALGATVDVSPAIGALRDFFAVVTARDYQHVHPLSVVIGKALEELGVPAAAADLLVWFVGDQIVAQQRDDCGLFIAVKAAEARFDGFEAALRSAERIDLAGGKETAPLLVAAGPEPEPPFSDLALAEAAVEFERLRCHIEENKFHYFQLVWAAAPDVEAWRTAFAGLECYLQRQPVGFIEDMAAYPILDPNTLQRWFQLGIGRRKLNALVEQILSDAASEPDKKTAISLPTVGTVAEAWLGECNACEPYIVESRLVDLRQQAATAAMNEAKARIDEAEATRRELRLQESPPNLADPVDHQASELHVTLSTGSNGDDETG